MEFEGCTFCSDVRDIDGLRLMNLKVLVGLDLLKDGVSGPVHVVVAVGDVAAHCFS